MPYNRKLIDYVPPYYDELLESAELLAAEDAEFARLHTNIDEVLRQFSVTTATWGLREWERICGITPKPGSTYEERRTRILVKLRGAAPATVANMLAIINAHVPQKNARIVELPEPGVIDVEIPLQTGVQFNSLSTDINEYKPAHLEFVLTIIAKIATFKLAFKSYEFTVSYPICNTFSTAELPGVMTRIGVNVGNRTYIFDTEYRITNEFTTEGYEAFTKMAADTSLNITTYDAPYVRLGEYEIGDGLRLGGYVNDEESGLTRVVMRSDVEESTVTYKRINDITLGEAEL